MTRMNLENRIKIYELINSSNYENRLLGFALLNSFDITELEYFEWVWDTYSIRNRLEILNVCIEKRHWALYKYYLKGCDVYIWDGSFKLIKNILVRHLKTNL